MKKHFLIIVILLTSSFWLVECVPPPTITPTVAPEDIATQTFTPTITPTPTKPNQQADCAGTIVASYRNPDKSGFLIIDSLSGDYRAITPPGEWINDMSISDNGRDVIFSDDKGNLSVLDVKSGNIMPLLTTLLYKQNPIWSPDEKQVAFTILLGDASSALFNLWTNGSNSSDLIDLSENGRYREEPADWSKSGDKILLYSIDSENQIPYLIFFYPANKKRVNIYKLPYPYSIYTARLSNDEKSILLNYYDEDNYFPNISILDLDTSVETKIPEIPPSSRSPAWSPDNLCIGFLNNDGIKIYQRQSHSLISLPVPENRYNRLDWGPTP